MKVIPVRQAVLACTVNVVLEFLMSMWRRRRFRRARA